VLTEIDAQQWQFTVPTAQPTNVGEPYGNVVVAPLQKAVVPLTTLPSLPTTTTTASTTTTTQTGGSTTSTTGGATTTTSTSITLPTTTTLTIPNPTPPSAADVTAATDADTPVTVTLSGSDLTDCELTFSIVGAPSHGTLGTIANHACSPGLPMSDTASVTYTPAPGFSGNDSFTYVVNDGTSNSSPATVRITVKPQAPPSCATGPVQGCRQPVRSQVGKLGLTDRSPDSRDRLLWKWSAGASTAKDDYGNPRATTNYELCVYDANGRTIARAGAPPDGPSGRSAWRETGSGFQYQQRDHAASGKGSAFKLSLIAGGDGQARIIAHGRGVALDMKPLPATQPVRVQLKNSNGTCWEATYSAPARRNTTGKFSDRND